MENTRTVHFIPVTPAIEDILKNQKLIFTTFLEGGVKPEKSTAWDSGLVFFSHSKQNVPIYDLDVAVDKWKSMIGEPKIPKILVEDGKPKDKRNQFSAHWLRHVSQPSRHNWALQ